MFTGDIYTSDSQVRIERYLDDVRKDDFVVRLMKMIRVPCAATHTNIHTKDKHPNQRVERESCRLL